MKFAVWKRVYRQSRIKWYLSALKTHVVPIYATEKIFSEVENKLEAFESSSKVNPQLRYGVLA